jgi:metal-dependent amidase/aminoacylase/carboxypeptidase family protein
LDAAVVSVTVFQSGSAFNVIPMSARLGGTARSLRSEIQDLVEARITAVAEAIASAHDCKATVRYERGYPVTENHPDATNRFREIARAEVGADRLVEIDRPAMGGEDFAYYGQVVPACFFLLGQRPAGETTMPELHSPRYDFNDSTIETGVRLFRRLAMEA